MTQTQHIEQLVKETALEAGTFIREHAYDLGTVEWKKRDDPVTWLDKKAEKMIRERIKTELEANIIGEEYGQDMVGSNITFYLDPIDGTKSFIRGEYNSSVSVMAEHNGKVVAGAVYDFMKDMLYFANTTTATLYAQDKDILLPRRDIPELNTPSVLVHNKLEEKFSEEEFSVRQQIGSVALSMAQTATGVYGALVMGPYDKGGVTNTCDIGAGYVLMKTVGLHLFDIDGKPYDYTSPENGIIAVSEKYEKQVLEALGTTLQR